ncbi:exopolyphosphatase PRUNE1-like isoform X1 [Daphnia magna]|uniref:exopolyphosphatase PRUNE1-like isoform X1 n=1 Tax=Daphnia magna TaxID=35525 RepID=UPI001E1BCB0D|nr:exopolyphosphatase PRUNE1-like isoform X1 [Daphnia magna]
MENFLKKSKANLPQIQSYDSVCVILGNESCDLDSAVCALVFAFFLEHKKKFSSVHLPVLNIAKEDYCLKTEVVYFLKRFNISSDHLIFRDDICLDSLKESGKLKLVLVDHNVLSNSDSNLDSSVVQIVDHHKQEHPFSEMVDMLIEPVGSCSTLVASLIFESAPEILDAVSASLLLGAIVVDVANFSATAKRATAKDEQIFRKLSQYVPNISKDILYKELQCAKEDVGNLKFEQLCQKDRKILEVGGIKLSICGFPFLCSTLLAKYPDITTKLQDFCNVSGYQGAVLMGISINHETDEVKRDLVIYSRLTWLKTRICRELEKGEPNLDLHAIKSNAEYVYYNQGNITATRKAVLPMLKVILSKPESSNNMFSHRGDRRTSVPNLHDESPPDGSSASNSGIDTPTNSCIDDDEEDRRSSPVAKLSEFNTGAVFANIESTKYVLFRRPGDELHAGERDPLTPENSFAESHFDQSYKKFVLNHMDSDAIEKKLRQENFFREADE